MANGCVTTGFNPYLKPSSADYTCAIREFTKNSHVLMLRTVEVLRSRPLSSDEIEQVDGGIHVVLCTICLSTGLSKQSLETFP